MPPESEDAHGDLLHRLLVPVANAEDARSTATALASYAPEEVTVLHVVEKGEGVPDKTPVEQSEELAQESFEAFREIIPDATDRIVYRRDIVAAIIDTANDIDATAIAFQSRGSSRLMQFLAGDRSLRLIKESNRPVIALPGENDG